MTRHEAIIAIILRLAAFVLFAWAALTPVRTYLVLWETGPIPPRPFVTADVVLGYGFWAAVALVIFACGRPLARLICLGTAPKDAG